jgi:hypothetical protein
MFTRRQLIQRGLSGAAIGLLTRNGFSLAGPAFSCNTAGEPSDPASPILCLPDPLASVPVKGLPFAEWFTGDGFLNKEIPFHGNEHCFGSDPPPAPTEEIDVAVVGGGVSGLATAYLLRSRNPVLFEMRERFGGVAAGERWAGTSYSLGNAYVITPDRGGFLDTLYHQLKLHEVVRPDGSDLMVEIGGRILDHLFDPVRASPEDAKAYQRYREVVTAMAENRFPEIPLPAGQDNEWILDLDRKTLRRDIEDQMGVAVPDLLASAIQAYCYSSFAAGWEEISAASGWNFLAAEESGRWVFPGGTSHLTFKLWDKLARLDRMAPPGQPRRLRSGCRVVDVRLAAGGRVQVTYKDSEGACRSLLAKKVAMCCSKMLARSILHGLDQIDEAKREAMGRLEYRAYVVANVLIDAPISRDFYDLFLLGDGRFPVSEPKAQEFSRVTDVLNGHYARPESLPRSVLTLYWPLPFNFGRWTLLADSAWNDYSQALVPQVHSMLGMLGVDPAAVRQVRMTRWGHAMPLALPGLIADGVTAHLRRPIDERIFFINQDNWALPAVETCLLDAEIFVPQIRQGL